MLVLLLKLFDQNDCEIKIQKKHFFNISHFFPFYHSYDDNKEIIGGSTHKSARLVVWQSNIYRLNRPPAVQFLQGQLLFHVQYTKDVSKMEKGHVNFMNFQEVILRISNLDSLIIVHLI